MEVRREARVFIYPSVVQGPEIKKRGGVEFFKRLVGVPAAAYRAPDKSFATQSAGTEVAGQHM